MQKTALDFSAHAAHFLLNGLPPEDLAMSKPAGGGARSESTWTFRGVRHHPVRPLLEHATASSHEAAAGFLFSVMAAGKIWQIVCEEESGTLTALPVLTHSPEMFLLAMTYPDQCCF